MTIESYRNRPGKTIERKMMVETFTRLATFAPVREYEYVGMGGHEFIDFELVWKALRIERMTSIESVTDYVERFEFNRPFGGIRVVPGESRDVLPLLDLSGRCIMWLDYTARLNESILGDIRSVASRMSVGSLLALTVNCSPAERIADNVARLTTDVGLRRVPVGTTDTKLALWGLAAVQRDIIVSEINVATSARGDNARFRQLFNFRYQDRSRMLTVGGLIIDDAAEAQWLKAGAENGLDFLRLGADAYTLRPPVITSKEERHLNGQLPVAAGSLPSLPGLSEEEAAAYTELHPWYPTA